MQSKIQICMISLLHTHGRRSIYILLHVDGLNISKLLDHALKQVMTFHPRSTSNPAKVPTYFVQQTNQTTLFIWRKPIIFDLQPIQCIMHVSASEWHRCGMNIHVRVRDSSYSTCRVYRHMLGKWCMIHA